MAGWRDAPYPAIRALFLVIFSRHAYPDFTHRVIFFFGHRPDHAGKLHLVADHRRGA
ncbi:hypothetical protein [Citrobacter rodentium]|uniref:hypothetical protein n=1 Tax=Citrobacter rodentium TaxID=67825 RepID=UPI004044F56B